MVEKVILCGGVQISRRSRKALQLNVYGPSANINLQSEDVGRHMLASLPSTLADLLDVATYVYAADRLIARGGETATAAWRRLAAGTPFRHPRART